ncbi:minichromosome maintenance protein MCM [Candidatus Woesearchaeota archaeon]|nr:minichromosome maintenance protein MCM [Candidatus Woesearchaeota archaeon]
MGEAEAIEKWSGTEQIERMHELIEKSYLPILNKNIRKGENALVIDFKEISLFDVELTQLLLERPEEVIAAAERAISQFDLEGSPKVKVRFTNLPESHFLMIRDIRSKHLGKFYQLDGIVRQKSDVRPQVTSAKFECPSCGNIISILQIDQSFKEPSRCGCGRKGKFNLLSKELVDAQGIVLEEAPERLSGGEQPKRMKVFLKDDLVSPLSERKTSPGSKITVTGIIKEVPILTKTGAQSTTFDLMIEANAIEAGEETFLEVEISEEEERQIKELAADPKYMEKLVESVAPSIYGYDVIKEAILLQLVGGVFKKRKDGVASRGDMHVLLVGDPGAGKSALLKRANTIAPKSRYVSGKGVSAAGLTASVVKDEFLRGWSLEAGAMVLASNGLCCIDEMDKISPEDRSAMHEAMENQTVSISKANIQATLIARTTVLAAANPKFGRFDPYGIVAEQIDLPPTLINRFDLIFTIKDLPDEKKDTQLAAHMLNLHQTPDSKEPEIDTNLLKKFIAYAKQKVFPKLSDGAIEEIKRYYIKMRLSGSTEEGIKSIPISARQLEALVRLSEAHARLRLGEEVTRKDAKNAIKILEYSLMDVGFDKETGKIDIDRIATGVSATARNVIAIIKESINDLEKKLGKTIPLEDIMAAGRSKGVTDDKIEEAIEKLKRTGDVFEPKPGFINKL